jgi:hypothetical protein
MPRNGVLHPLLDWYRQNVLNVLLPEYIPYQTFVPLPCQWINKLSYLGYNCSPSWRDRLSDDSSRKPRVRPNVCVPSPTLSKLFLSLQRPNHAICFSMSRIYPVFLLPPKDFHLGNILHGVPENTMSQGHSVVSIPAEPTWPS